MKHIFYHLTAVMVVVVWGMTFISTKVLIVHGLSAQEIFLFRFLLAYAAVCPISFHRFFARNLKDELYLVGGGVLGGSLFFFLQNIALGLTQASNVSFIICMAPLLTAVLTVLSVRTEKGLKRLHIRIYYCSVGCRLADIQRKFHSSDITFGRFTDSSSFPVMGVLQSCHSESHPKIFSGFHHQKDIFLWHNNNSSHFPFSALIDKSCCITGQ